MEPSDLPAIGAVSAPAGRSPGDRPAEARGLSAGEVAERVAAGRTNATPPRASRSAAAIARANVFTRFNAIIGVLFVTMLVVGPFQDALFGFVIVVNTGIGIIQEVRAKRTLDRLAVVGEARPRVRRDGADAEVDAAGIVIDDLVLLAPGETVLVDGTITASQGLEVDESLLTGESDPVSKRLGDRVMSGSFAVAGTGEYRATGVGDEAYAARIVGEAGRFTLVRSELRSGIDRVLGWIGWAVIPVSALLIVSQLRSQDTAANAVRFAVAGIVPLVPEGLVLLTSIAFAVGVVRLGRRDCLVQELPAIEGLARVDTVCVDKTGTLTEEGMAVAEVRTLDPALPVREALGALVGADPRPNASIAAIAAAPGVTPPAGWKAAAVVPFSSARKWSGAEFVDRGSWILGAPDMLLPTGHSVLLEADALGADGFRVLLLARTQTSLDTATADVPLADVPLADVGGADVGGAGVGGAGVGCAGVGCAGVGCDEICAPEADPAALVILEQRLRSDAADTLAYFARQNVTVKVISGDNAVAVGAVASRLGLPGADKPVDARDLPEDEDEFAAAIEEHSVFGRVTPRQKKAMVLALRSRGHTVAMTGDGVNDVLALKEADIGVAMGSGSAASRAVAQVVLLDDRFATLPHVVAEGRRVIGNIERVANLFLTKTFYSLVLAVLIGALAIPFPFLPRHTTLIGTMTIGVPAFFLALAPNPARARAGFVRRTLRFSVPVGVVVGLGTFTAYELARADYSSELASDRTTAVATLALLGLWVLAIVARPYTWWKVLLILAVAGVTLLAFVVSPAEIFFALQARNRTDLVTGLGIAVTGAFLMELVRLPKASVADEDSAAGG